jgi:hypothetical protein
MTTAVTTSHVRPDMSSRRFCCSWRLAGFSSISELITGWPGLRAFSSRVSFSGGKMTTVSAES